MSYDSILKFLIEANPQAFTAWLLNKSSQVELLNVELNLEPIRADGLFFLRAEDKILHLEFQTTPQSSPPMGLRMLDYWVRLVRQYDTDIEQVVIYLKQTDSPQVWTNRWQKGNTSHSWRVIRIWEENPSVFLQSPALYPLAPLAKTTNPQSILATVAHRVATIEDRRQRSNISACVQLLAGLRFDLSVIQMYFREDIMQESVVYQYILERGRQEGFREGIDEGKKREIQLVVTRLLRKKLGQVNPKLLACLEELSLQQLEDLGEELLDFQTEADLQRWLAARLDNVNTSP